ncbi:MAG: tetratricopeptide repeat protein [Lysobacteraceae bacterium]
MAIDDQEEYEQGEQVRIWLRNNGTSIIGGIAIGLVLIAGWQWWQRKQEMQGQDAAAAYAVLSDTVRDHGDQKRIATLANALHADYGKTTYATLAALTIAAHQMDLGDAKSALATLDGAGQTSDTALAALIRVRSARVLLSLGKPEDALKRLGSKQDPAFTAIAGEIRGDAERALGHLDNARQAYLDALSHMPPEAPNRIVLEMKLADIGGVAPKPEAKKV